MLTAEYLSLELKQFQWIATRYGRQLKRHQSMLMLVAAAIYGWPDLSMLCRCSGLDQQALAGRQAQNRQVSFCCLPIHTFFLGLVAKIGVIVQQNKCTGYQAIPQVIDCGYFGNSTVQVNVQKCNLG